MNYLILYIWNNYWYIESLTITLHSILFFPLFHLFWCKQIFFINLSLSFLCWLPLGLNILSFLIYLNLMKIIAFANFQTLLSSKTLNSISSILLLHSVVKHVNLFHNLIPQDIIIAYQSTIVHQYPCFHPFSYLLFQLYLHAPFRVICFLLNNPFIFRRVSLLKNKSTVSACLKTFFSSSLLNIFTSLVGIFFCKIR